MPSHSLEPLFGIFTEKRVLLTGQSRRRDLRPVLRLQSLDRGWKEITLFRGDMVPLLHDEVANDAVYGVPRDFLIHQYTLDRLRDPVQTLGSAPMLGREIANLCRSGGIARFQLLEYPVLLRMMVGIGIDPEISNDRPDNFVIRALSPIEDAQLLFKNEKEHFDVAMFLVQNINNHRFDRAWII